MTERRFDDIEQRTKKVEEAVIRFSYIADTVLIQHDTRLSKLEADVDSITNSIYLSCDAKTKEIDTKISDAFNSAQANTEKLFKQSMGISIGMFGLFIGALTYLNSEHGRIYERINLTQQESVEHRTNIHSILDTMTKIEEKLDKLREELK